MTLALLGGLAARARAETPDRPHEWNAEFRFSTVYYPDADETPGVGPVGYTAGGVPKSSSPFKAIYGSKHRLLSQLEVDRDLWQGFGSLAVGGSIGYAEFYGHGISAATLEQGGATSSFHVLPLKLLATYRFDPFVPQGVPIVPFVRGGLDWVVYWNAMQSGQISFLPPASQADMPALGLTTGVEGTVGLALVLDWIDPDLAHDIYDDLGIARTSFVLAYTDQIIENGPGNVIHAIRTGGAAPIPVIDLSARYFEFGLDFAF